MCGRARASMTAAAVASAAGVSEARWRDREQYRPRYNASPGAWLPVLRMAPPAGAEEQHAAEGKEAPEAAEAPRERLLQTMRWGLVPSFTRKDATPNFFRAFNARSDTAADKAMFSRLLSRKRCVVLLNGFYEWRAEGQGSLAVKQPYYLHLATEVDGGDKAAAAQPAPADEDAPEALLRAAALYDRWEGPEGPLYTVTILTTDSAPQLRWLHDRMPVFLRTDAEECAWLEGATPEKTLREVSRPEAGPPLTWHPVSCRMSKGDVDDPECCKPAPRTQAKDAGSVAALFARAGGSGKHARDALGDAADAAAEGEAWQAEGTPHAPRPAGAKQHAEGGASPPPSQEAPPTASPPSARKKHKAAAATPLPKGQQSVATFFKKAEQG